MKRSSYPELPKTAAFWKSIQSTFTRACSDVGRVFCDCTLTVSTKERLWMLVGAFGESPKKVLRNLLGQNASTFRETLKKAEENPELAPIREGNPLPFVRFQFLWSGASAGELRAYFLTDIPVRQLKQWLEEMLTQDGWHTAQSWKMRYPLLWQTAKAEHVRITKEIKDIDSLLDTFETLKRSHRLFILKSEAPFGASRKTPAAAKNEVVIPAQRFEDAIICLAIAVWGAAMAGWLFEETDEQGQHAFASALLAVRFDPGISWHQSSNDKSVCILNTAPRKKGAAKAGMGTLFGRPGIPLVPEAGSDLYTLTGAVAPHDYGPVRLMMTMRKRGCPWGFLAMSLPGEVPFLLLQSGLGSALNRVIMIESSGADLKKSALIRALLEKAESPEVRGRIHPTSEIVAAIERALSPRELSLRKESSEIETKIGYIPGAGTVADAKRGSLGEVFQEELIGERIAPERISGGIVSRGALGLIRLGFLAVRLLSRKFAQKMHQTHPSDHLERCTSLYLAQQGVAKSTRSEIKPETTKARIPLMGCRFAPFRILVASDPKETEEAVPVGGFTEADRERSFDFRMFLEKTRRGGLSLEARQSASLATSSDITLIIERDQFLRYPIDDFAPVAPWILSRPKNTESEACINLAPMLALAANSEALRNRLENFRDICHSAAVGQPRFSALLLATTQVDWSNPLDLLRVFDPVTIAKSISDDPDFWKSRSGDLMIRLGITGEQQQHALRPALLKNAFWAVCELLRAAATELAKGKGLPHGWTRN